MSPLNSSHSHENRPETPGNGLARAVEQLSGWILSLTLVAIGAFTIAAYFPKRTPLVSEAFEVLVVLILLFASLILVAVSALLKTGRS